MKVLEKALRDLASDLEPTPLQKSAASRSHNYLRDQMATGTMGGRILDSYLSGSYARKTAIRPLEDVDIIFLLDKSKWSRGILIPSMPSPSVVLRSFADALRYRYDKSGTFQQRRSIRLELNHLDIDCVPAISIAGSDFILVGDRKKDEWIKSSPKLHAAALTKANGLCEGCAVPAIKILKAWNRSLPSTARMRSFMVETMAVTILTAVPVSSLEEAVFMFFDFASKFAGKAVLKWDGGLGITLGPWLGVNVPDLAGTGGNIAGGVDFAEVEKFLAHAVRARDGMVDARKARTEAKSVEHLLKALRLSA